MPGLLSETSLADAWCMLDSCMADLPLPFALIDAQFRIIMVSRRWRENYSVEGEVAGRSLEEVFPGMYARYQTHFARVLQGETLSAEGSLVQRRDGSSELIDWTMSPWRKQDGRVGGMVFFSEVVTARHRLDEEIRYLRTLERALSGIATSLIAVPFGGISAAIDEGLGEIGRLSGMDRAYIFEFDSGRTSMSNTYEWCAPGIESMKARLQDVPCTSVPWWMSRILQGRDIVINDLGEMPAEAATEKAMLESQGVRSLVVVPLTARDGQYAFLGLDATVQVRQISEHYVSLLHVAGRIMMNAVLRRNAEEAFQESEARARMLLENAADALFLVAADGRIADVNSNACQQTGYAREEIIGMPIQAIDDSFDFERLREEMRRNPGSVVVTVEGRITRRDGKHYPVETRICRFPGRGVPMAVAVARDISQRKDMEEQQKALIFDLKEALANVKTLSGLLPICSHCKKIRDDKGYWHKVEKYIAGHSSASFTHGLCPDCLERQYGEDEVHGDRDEGTAES